MCISYGAVYCNCTVFPSLISLFSVYFISLSLSLSLSFSLFVSYLLTSSQLVSDPQLLGYNEKPVNLQMFIGTADDRYLRPHAFYQVHRITGKTVATASQEIIISSTKVLEIPLLPENNMTARYLS